MFKSLEEITKEFKVENKTFKEMTREELFLYFRCLFNALDETNKYDYEMFAIYHDSDWFGNCMTQEEYDEAVKEADKECEIKYIVIAPNDMSLAENEFDQCEEEIVKRAQRIAKDNDLSGFFSCDVCCNISLWNSDVIQDCWQDYREFDERTDCHRWLFVIDCLEIIKKYGNQ